MTHDMILASIQGITEFLPVSSSAHLIVAAKFFGIQEPGRLLEVILHMGTLGVVLLYFHKSIISMVQGFYQTCRGKASPGMTEFLKILVGSLPVIILGYIVHTSIPDGVSNLRLIAWVSIIMGSLMVIVDMGRMHYKTYPMLNFRDAFFIGCIQSFALIPGASRLGASLIGARILGYQRDAAAKFSFLLSIPAVLGANTLVGYSLYKEGLFHLNMDVLTVLTIAFGVGLLSLTFFMYWIKNYSLKLFGIYRILFGIALLVI